MYSLCFGFGKRALSCQIDRRDCWTRRTVTLEVNSCIYCLRSPGRNSCRSDLFTLTDRQACSRNPDRRGRNMKSLNGTGNLYSSGLQLLLLAGTLALQVPQALGYFNTKAIAGMSDHIKGTWLKLKPVMYPRDLPGLFAVCNVQPSSDLRAGLPAISGYILFHQENPDSGLDAYFELQGFPADDAQSERAIHVHQFGDLSGGCGSTGPHYNPFDVYHPNHPGDFHNFQVRNGKIVKHLIHLKPTLYGVHTILGRGVVVHQGKDDLGFGGNPESLQSGNSGTRLACCTIGLSKGDLWQQMVHKV